MTKAVAYVDGSYNANTKVFGYGGFLIYEDEEHIVQGSSNDMSLAPMRNVAGEIAGSMAAVAQAIRLGAKTIDLYYDYLGIEMWVTGKWKCNKRGTMDYRDFMRRAQMDIHINFIKVKGHSGDEGNERADKLAKMAVGLKLK